MSGLRRTSPGFALFFSWALASGCSRSAEIADEPDWSMFQPETPRDATPLQPIDGGVDPSGFAACTERPLGDACRGVNDFPCNFERWAIEVVSTCQAETGCVSNGRVAAEMGDEGCVTGLLMSEPNDDFARCALEHFAAYQCTCGATSAEVTLGYGNSGCDQPILCGGVEFPCPAGQTCGADGYCRPEY